MKLVFTRKWESAHRFIEGENRATLCSQPHGHTWYVQVELSPTHATSLNSTTNTLALFAEAKGAWHKFVDQSLDHAFFANHNDPIIAFLLQHNPNGRLVITPGDPTTEMIAALLKSKCETLIEQSGLPLRCSSLKIQETPTNAVLLDEPSSKWIPQLSEKGRYWWTRSDMTTHDLSNFPKGYPIIVE